MPNYRRIGKIERSQPIMEEAIFSPDGKFMWTGSQWIPAPPEESDPAIIKILVLGFNILLIV